MFALAAFAAACASANAAAHVEIRANTIGYFPGDWLLAASGHVSVSDGTRTIAADDVRYDLFHEKLVAIGHVRMTRASGDWRAPHSRSTGAAANCTTSASAATPEALAESGARAPAAQSPPAGTFDVADIAGYRPYIKGPHAIVIPQTSVRFTPAIFPTGLGSEQ